MDKSLNARTGDFIMATGANKKSLGLVLQVDEEIGMMYVNYPKAGKPNWVMWENRGQYIVIGQ